MTVVLFKTRHTVATVIIGVWEFYYNKSKRYVIFGYLQKYLIQNSLKSYKTSTMLCELTINGFFLNVPVNYHLTSKPFLVKNHTLQSIDKRCGQMVTGYEANFSVQIA